MCGGRFGRLWGFGQQFVLYHVQDTILHGSVGCFAETGFHHIGGGTDSAVEVGDGVLVLGADYHAFLFVLMGSQVAFIIFKNDLLTYRRK